MAGARALTGWAAQVVGLLDRDDDVPQRHQLGIKLAGSDDWHLTEAPPIGDALYYAGPGTSDERPRRRGQRGTGADRSGRSGGGRLAVGGGLRRGLDGRRRGDDDAARLDLHRPEQPVQAAHARLAGDADGRRRPQGGRVRDHARRSPRASSMPPTVPGRSAPAWPPRPSSASGRLSWPSTMRRAEAADGGDAWLALLGAPAPRSRRGPVPPGRLPRLRRVRRGSSPPAMCRRDRSTCGSTRSRPSTRRRRSSCRSGRSWSATLPSTWAGWTRWQPPPIEPRALRTIPPETVAQLTGASESALADHPAVALAASRLLRGDLPAVVAALAGRGVGLTPAGDDVLSGILLVLAGAGHDREVLALAAGRAAHPPDRPRLPHLGRARTGRRTRPPPPGGTGRQADGAAIRRHQRAVEVLGHTSGADLLLGLRLGLGALLTGGRRRSFRRGAAPARWPWWGCRRGCATGEAGPCGSGARRPAPARSVRRRRRARTRPR